VADGGALACGDQARLPAEHRIPQVEDEVVAAELRADRGRQLLQKARRPGKPARGGKDGHHDTRFPDSQPAFSSAARASSAVRCP
jgi:hypothetical protein